MRQQMPVMMGAVALVAALSMPGAAGAAVAAPYDPFFAKPRTAADFGSGTRPFGVAAGDYDEDGDVDLVIGRTTGQVAFVAGNGDGTFAAPETFDWRAGFFNAWAFAPADVNGDGHLDVVWGANSAISGGAADGDVRAWLGNGDGSFGSSGSRNAGELLADIGTDAGSVAAGDIDGDGDDDVVAGAVDGSNSVVRVVRNDGDGAFSVETLISQPSATALGEPIYFPARSTQNSPWGLALGDADADGDLDLWVGDRALYVYLYENDGAGSLALRAPNSGVPSTRTNAYLDHDAFRAAVGFTPALGSGDVNGDGRADLALGLHSGTQNPNSEVEHDGQLLLDVSEDGAHTGFGALADIGTMARGTSVVDVDGDSLLDLIAASYEGEVQTLRQLTPIDSDADGVSDYVDNAPEHPNAARIDMNTDGSVNHHDQLDNEFDTVLGDAEDETTWERLGDPADADDDNDDVGDATDNCRFVANGAQADADADGRGDACDPLDDHDPDADQVPTGPLTGDPLYDDARDAAIRWSRGDTHFVIRIDALGRFFQNEFTQLMTDAATLPPSEWEAKCGESYGPGGGDPPDPCGPDETTVTLPGGKQVPITLVVIPKQLWTDPPVVEWINDRNDSARLEIGQHGTYHANNTRSGDWAALGDRDFLSCETCGLTLAESFQLLKAGRHTLLGDYENRWIAESGATPSSPAIDWSASANPLISYAPPFNASDTASREATARLGYKAFSASVSEESQDTTFGPIFSPEGSHHERFDQFGMFHASADLELEPPETEGGAYDEAEYADYLEAQTDDGGLTTWLIEEVEWSGRPCNDLDRLGSCDGGSNRENNTVYPPRWQGWMQLLDHVRDYPGGVVMTIGDVALAKGFDNAPTVANGGQEDSDNDAIGDAIDGASLTAPDATLNRNDAGVLETRLTNGAGDPIADQLVRFAFDADGDGSDEQLAATTDSDGRASVEVTATRPVGPAAYSVAWDGMRAEASAVGEALVVDETALDLADAVAMGNRPAVARATLTDEDGAPVVGRPIEFYAIDSAGNAGARRSPVLLGSDGTDADGVAELEVPMRYISAGQRTRIRAVFEGDSLYLRSEDEAFAYREPCSLAHAGQPGEALSHPQSRCVGF